MENRCLNLLRGGGWGVLNDEQNVQFCSKKRTKLLCYLESLMQRMRPSIVWHDIELSSFRTFSCDLKASKDRRFPQNSVFRLHFQDILPKTCNSILKGLKSPSHCSVTDRTGVPCFFFICLFWFFFFCFFAPLSKQKLNSEDFSAVLQPPAVISSCMQTRLKE